MNDPGPIDFGESGLIPAVTVDATTGDVLMIGFLNGEALAKTRSSGYVHYWSRSRQKLWLKGETSGHRQRVESISVNCDQNTLKIEVEQIGAVCHDGYPTCYYRRLEPDNTLTLVRDRWFDPADVYGTPRGGNTLVDRWWGAYAFLAANDLTAQSSTSTILRDHATSTTGRVADELRELAGVIGGSHRHSDLQSDVTLEGSQVCYWLVLSAIKAGISHGEVRADRAMELPESEPLPTAAVVARLLTADTDRWETTTGVSAEVVHETFRLVAVAARIAGVAPLSLIEADLRDLRSRSCLVDYFASLA